MYRCDVCGVVVPPGQKERRVVAETRPKTYRHPIYPRTGSRKHRRTPIKWVESQGWEIARELRICSSEACYEKATANATFERGSSAGDAAATALAEAMESAEAGQGAAEPQPATAARQDGQAR